MRRRRTPGWRYFLHHSPILTPLAIVPRTVSVHPQPRLYAGVALVRSADAKPMNALIRVPNRSTALSGCRKRPGVAR